MNVIGYIRVSTQGQIGEDRYGMAAQEEDIRAYCARNGMEIVRWVRDEGESGAKERPGFDEIVYGEVTNPPIEAVVAGKTDRVARDINVYYYYKMMLKKKDIQLYSVAEDFGQMGVFATMLEAFTLCVAEMERENIRKRTSGGRRVKASQGGYSGGRPPLGYRVENGQLKVIPEEAETVRRIFALTAEGKSRQKVCDVLNAEGRVNKSGKRFSPSTVQTVLENERMYRGEYRYGKNDIWVTGQHEAILGEDA